MSLAAALLAAPAAAREHPSNTDAAVTVASFNLGLVQIAQPGGTGRFAYFPTELKGVIGVPAGAARRPIVVILHGRHGTGCPETADLEQWPCPASELRHELGFRYLVRALALRSFVAVSVNVNAADTNGWGEPSQSRVDRILGQVLRRLATANDGGANAFGVPLASRIDFARLGLIGHSQRGGRAVAIARNRAAHPGPVAQGRGRIASLLLLGPVPGGGQVPDTTALALVLPECDNDVRGLEGLGYFDRAGDGRRKRPAALAYLRRANHNFFNRSLSDEGGHERPGCVSRAQRLSRAAQTAWLARYAPTFFRSTLFGLPARAVAGLDPGARAPRRVFGRRVLTSLVVPKRDRLVLQRPARTTAGATVRLCRRGRRCRSGLWQPTYPQQLLVEWRNRGAVLDNGLSLPKDVRRFAAVRLRVAVDPTSSNNRRRPQTFSLVLRDSRGRTAAAVVPRTEPALGFPRGRFGRGTRPLSYVVGSDARVPLGALRGVSLRRIVSVALRFDRTSSGSLLVQDLELVAR